MRRTWQSVANIVLRGRTKLGSMFWMTSKDHGHWKKYLTRLFENKLFSDPKNCLLFFPPILHSSRKESELASFVNEKMGPSCSMLTLKVEGVIGTDTEDKVFEVEDFIAFSGLLLPAMPGVTVRQFHLCKKKVMRLAKGVSIDMVLCTILGLAIVGWKGERGNMGCLLVREKQVFERTESVVTRKLGRLQ
ncbi:unnamed protein product, partial [Timema podura]|nr:unnamed protein product [Timema podura]